MSSIHSLEQMAESENPKKRLQAAFLQHSRGNIKEAKQLVDSVGDISTAAIQLSHEMINETPSHDPRWEANPGRMIQQGSQKSLLIQKQISEKAKIHSVFVQFIKSHLDDDAVSEIIQDGEKIAAAQTLRNSSSVLQGTLDEAIGVVIRQRGVRVAPSLTKQDLFYSQISEVGEIIQVLACGIEEQLTASASKSIDLKKLEAVYKGTQLICAFLNSCVLYRQENSDLIASRNRFWTNILHEPLTRVFLLIGKEKLELKEQGMVEQLYIISRFILNDRKLFVSSQEGGEEEFFRIRGDLIKLLLENDHWSEAGLLSEQFHDFENLIHVYTATKNESDFARYLKISGFPQFVHKNFSGEKLIDIGVRHGGEIKELILADKTHGWMLEARSESYSAAHEKLAANAGEADMSLSRKSYLSIAKLAAIAGGNSSPEPTTAEILLDFQDELPDPLNRIQSNTKAMDAYDIIDCLTNSELRNLTLTDAKNALAAFKYADEADKRELNALIWARIIKSEIESAHWRRALENAHQPQEAISGTKFTLMLESCSEYDLLPDVNDVINHPELVDYQTQSVVSFIVGAAIEARAQQLQDQMDI